MEKWEYNGKDKKEMISGFPQYKKILTKDFQP
jgi:hypothetical protein